MSRIFLLQGNTPLARCYLRLAAARSGIPGGGDSPGGIEWPGGVRRGDSFGEVRCATLRLGILVNEALVLKARGRIARASELLRAVVDWGADV